MGGWDWQFAWEITPRLLFATINTLFAAGAGYSIAIVLGLVLAVLQHISPKAVKIVTREMIEFVRSTPLILQIFFIFYVGPQVGLTLSPWSAGIIAIGLHYSAYLSEVYRAGIESVPRGQWEAATALNLSVRDTWVRIVIPQGLLPVIPGLGNYLVGILKDTPMLAVIGVAELMHTANSIGSENYRFLEPFTIVGLIFLTLSLPAAGAVRFIEYRLRSVMGMK